MQGAIQVLCFTFTFTFTHEDDKEEEGYKRSWIGRDTAQRKRQWGTAGTRQDRMHCEHALCSLCWESLSDSGWHLTDLTSCPIVNHSGLFPPAWWIMAPYTNWMLQLFFQGLRFFSAHRRLCFSFYNLAVYFAVIIRLNLLLSVSECTKHIILHNQLPGLALSLL